MSDMPPADDIAAGESECTPVQPVTGLSGLRREFRKANAMES
jgi:hypothetical protein